MIEDFEEAVILIHKLFEEEDLNISVGTEPKLRIIFEPDSVALDNALKASKIDKEKFRLFEKEISELTVAIFTGIGVTFLDETKVNIVRKKFFGRKLRHNIVSRIEDTEKEFEHNDWSLQVSSIENTVRIETTKTTFRPIIIDKGSKQKISFVPNMVRSIEGNYENSKEKDLVGKEQDEMIKSISSEERDDLEETSKYKTAFQMIQKNSLMTLTLLLFGGLVFILLNPLVGMILISWGITNEFLSIYFLWKETGILVINSRLIILGTIGSICLLIVSVIIGLFLRQGHYWNWIG